MSEMLPMQGVKAAVEITSDIVRLARDNPDAKEAGRYVAQSVNILANTLHTVLLPLSAVNFGVKKFAEYMTSKFEKELSDVTAHIPPEHLVSPKPSLAGPTLQSLTFAFDEPNLKDLYLRLLATAMDG
jgi:hypothetical protein